MNDVNPDSKGGGRASSLYKAWFRVKIDTIWAGVTQR